MMKQNISLGRVFGIPIGLDYSWFLVFILVTWILATSYYPAAFSNWSPLVYWITGGVTAIMFFGSVLLHELGHSVIALRNKVPVHSITLFIFGGVSQIEKEPPSAIAEFWIAIAGILVSFILAGVFYLLQMLAAPLTPFLAVTQYLAYINLTLAIFNLIPGFPLDGGRVFRAIVWGVSKSFRRATLIAANLGRVVAFLFILYGVFLILNGNLGNGLWIAFIGWFLESAANAQVQQQLLHDLLTGHTVTQAMSRNYVIIPDNLPIQELADRHILGEGARLFVVTRRDEIVGLITLGSLRKIPRPNWPSTVVSQVMTPIDEKHTLCTDEDLEKAMQEMEKDGVDQLPVMDGTGVVGVLSRQSILDLARTLKEMGHA